MTDVSWWKIKKQSLALAAREAGFDLTVYEDYGSEVQTALKSVTIKNAMWNIEETFEEVSDGRLLKEIKRGVYVICLSYPFTINYSEGSVACSDIVYIGRGSLHGRLKSHYEKSLFKLMRSLAGASFDFYLTEPKRQSETYFKHIEYLMLDAFWSKTGTYPLLNAIGGSEQSVRIVGEGWRRPLQSTGKRPIWQLQTTKHWDIDTLD